MPTPENNLVMLPGGPGAKDPAAAAFVQAEEIAERLKAFSLAAKAAETRRAYQGDWKHFAAWCLRSGAEPLPAQPETVARYLAAHAYAHRPATLARRVVAIAVVHRAGGHEPPTRAEVVRTVLQGIRKSVGTAQNAKTPVLTEDLAAMLDNLPRRLDDGDDTPLAKRDRLLLLLGWSAALRRSELVALNAEDVRIVPEGLVVTLRRSKTDQEGEGRRIGIPHSRHDVEGECAPTCPVAALRAWLAETGIRRGPLFLRVDRHGRVLPGQRLTGHAVGRVVKRCAEAAGLDPAHYGGHSLRAGLATSAARGGAEEREIARVTGHKSARMLRHYIRDGEMFRESAARAAGL
jgi:integrase